MSAAEALAPERSVDEVRESLSVTEKGQPANTIGNCRTVFCHDPLLRGAIRLNLLTDRVDIVRDLGWRRNTSALTDTDVKYLLLYFEQTYGLTSEKKMTAALSIVANENCYHPIQDVLNGLNHFIGHFFFGLVRFGSFSNTIYRNLALALSKLHINVDITVGFFVGQKNYRLHMLRPAKQDPPAMLLWPYIRALQTFSNLVASVSGPQEMYTTRFGCISATESINSSVLPLLGGSINTTSALSPLAAI